MIIAYKLPEIQRKAFVFSILKKNGKFNANKSLFFKFVDRQNKDGGWHDVFETATVSYLIRDHLYLESNYKKAIKWLKGQKSGNPAWGYTKRDISRIPVTGLVLTLLPELADQASLTWLENEWRKDLNGETTLTYKGAFTLMAFASTDYKPQDTSLITDTIQYLASEQNDDGGFAPWKNHPVNSEPWSTGIVLIGLLAFPDLVNPEIIEKTLDWLAENQLPNGLWPCHYLEEGSSYCYWAAVEAIKFLEMINR